MISIAKSIISEEERKAEVEKHFSLTEENPSQQSCKGLAETPIAKDDAAVSDNPYNSQAQKCPRSDLVILQLPFKLPPVLPIIAAAMKTPDQMHLRDADKLTDASEPLEEATGSPTHG